ncbi:hypothetical protein [Sessilibacter corallicola]|uniref:hypothetical protein n=1 Tax=Sessilibacter corallicola TaxID=2904075 RepID=UPI001E5EB4CB|nr:hypothetical protein [Sessilibacter corallicola]MCE2027830.1 hypothetical protein [Sessilibacter corallicola]
MKKDSPSPMAQIFRLTQIAAASAACSVMVACTYAEPESLVDNRHTYPTAPETAVKYLPLAEPLIDGDSEMSALTWCGDELMVFPQYPDFKSGQPAAIFSFTKSVIIDAVKAENSTEGLVPKSIAFEGIDLLETIYGYEGIEAAVCSGDDITLAIETNQLGSQEATVLVGAKYSGDKIVVHSIGETLLSPTKLSNKGNESLVQVNGGLLSLHEVNDTRLLNYNESAYFLNSFEDTESLTPVADIPYRITDATMADESGRFWVINYQYQRDTKLVTDKDPIWEKYGIGESHKSRKQVERLVELEFDGNNVFLTDTPPIQIELEGTRGRNWEGIARLDDVGFLLVTDKFPRSLLGFVPYDAP